MCAEKQNPGYVERTRRGEKGIAVSQTNPESPKDTVKVQLLGSAAEEAQDTPGACRR